MQPAPPKPFSAPPSTVKAPAPYRPVAQAINRKPAPNVGNLALERRPAPPVYRPQPSGLPVQRMLGGSYFSPSGGGDDDEYRRNAERDLGKTPGHGSSKHGKDSGMNRATTDHEAKLVEHIRKQKADAYKASRPKANIYQASALSDFQKAEKKAVELKGSISDLNIRHREFLAYLERKGFAFNDDETYDLEVALGLYGD